MNEPEQQVLDIPLIEPTPVLLPEPPQWIPHSMHEAFMQGYERGYRNGYRNMAPEASAAIRTLEGLRFTYHGGRQWKPPLAQRPEGVSHDLGIEHD